MRAIIISIVLLCSGPAVAYSLGDDLAQEISQARVHVSPTWTWHLDRPVWVVTVDRPDRHAVARAADAVMRAQRAEFQGFSWAQSARINQYVVDQREQGAVQVIWLDRMIETDWLIGG